MDKKISLSDLFITFVKTGIILIGGGYVIFPVLLSVIVDKKGWLNDDEVFEYFSLSQSLPGIIAANVSIFVGYRLRGKSGAVVALLGLITPAFLAICLLVSIISKISSNSVVQGVLWGVEIAVIVLILSSVREIWTKAMSSKFSFFVYFLVLGLIFGCNLSPALTIVCSIVISMAVKLLFLKENKDAM